MPITNPEETHHVFEAAANAGDVEALVELYEPNAAIVERTGELTIGREPIRSHVEALLTLKPKMKIIESRAFVNRDIALLCSHWTATAQTPDGKQLQLDFRGSEVVREQPDGTWRMILDNPWGIELNGH